MSSRDRSGGSGAGAALARRLPFSATLALRYLRSTRRDAFVSFLSAVAGGGICLGVAALIVVLAALSGFQEALKREILLRTPQVEVRPPRGADAVALRATVEALPGVEEAQVVVLGRGWLLAGGKVRRVEIVGFERRLPSSFPEASGRGPGLYLPDRLTASWGLAPGEVVEVASNRPTLGPLGPQPRVQRLPLAGTFAAGRTEQEERIALPLLEAERLLGVGDRRLEVRAGGLDAALQLAPRLAAILPPGSEVSTWRDLNRALFFALRLEKSVTFVAVALIILVAALALISDLMLIISTKRAEIGMLGAMGASPAAIRRAFLLLGGALAGLGGVAGAALGVAGAWALDRYRLLSLPRQVYFLDYVPFRLQALDLASVLLLTLGLAMGCALWAAARAAALEPVEALRR